jgi:hypothetical protein
MPNSIKYNVSAETLALKKGNFWIGTGDVEKGPTSSTGYYNGITPPSGGYTIYLNKSSGGPSIYTVTTEAQMVSLTNSIGSQNFTTSGQCLNWFATQTDKMIFNIDYPAVVTNGLILNVDAGFTPSYSRSGTTWYDVSSSNNGTLTNGPTFNSANDGNIVFDGVDDYVSVSCASNTVRAYNSSTEFVIKLPLYSGGQRGILSYRSVSSLYIGKGNGGIFVYYNTLNVPGYTVGNITNGAIAHCVVICDADNNLLSTYINGTLAGSVSRTGWVTTYNTTLDLGYDVGTYEYMDGNMYLFRHYNRVLSAAEVLQNFNATKSRFGL